MFKHASRLSEYRRPFGAAPAGSNVELIFEATKDSTDVVLCYSYGLYGFSYHEEPMNSKGRKYKIELMLPVEAGLLFYWFRASVPYATAKKLLPEMEDQFRFKHWPDTVYLYYVFDPESQNGGGRLYFEPPKIGVEEDKYPYAWQITVYDESFKTPDFLKGARIYQIFPDRFNRGKDHSYKKISPAFKRPERIWHKDWNEDVDIYGKPETGYLACDFFGGTLDGIREKLDYIQSLGITVLYLNPIFEARSSHRYDTADYMNVDPILGGNEAFERLAAECKERGIKIILDGVFSHTGADSRYFNKFDRYEGTGAYRSFLEGSESKYRSWYNFTEIKDGEAFYESWWGFPDLPNVNEDDLSYRRFIFGKGGVVDTWIQRGASGFRLDVSDELPDSFIRQMRKTVAEYSNGTGAVIGEVWEDASNKCSYGSYRDFMLGRTHDSVMGYTFRDGLLNFLKGNINAPMFNSYMEGFRERYPAQGYYSMMNLISSHDVPRAITEMAGEEDPGDRELQKEITLSEDELKLGSKLMRMAYAFQTGYIGASCIYYGDEILMEGYRDPFNRRTYPWGAESEEGLAQLQFVRQISHLRDEHPVLRTGFYKTLFAEENMLVFERSLDKNRKDYFGNKVVDGSRRVVLLLNSDATRYLSMDNKTGSFTISEEGEDDELYIVNIRPDEDVELTIPPRSLLFIIYTESEV